MATYTCKHGLGDTVKIAVTLLGNVSIITGEVIAISFTKHHDIPNYTIRTDDAGNTTTRLEHHVEAND